MDPRRGYRVLGLPYGASTEEVKTAWRDLAQVWHPDRFPASSRLRTKAEENLKRINAAYDALRDYQPTPEGPGFAARVRDSVAVGLGDLRDSIAVQAPIGLRRSLRVLGLGIRRTGEMEAPLVSSRWKWVVAVGAAVAVLAVAAAMLLRQ